MPLSHTQLDRAIQAHMDAHHIVGLAACRVQDGDIVWENGFGAAELSSAEDSMADSPGGRPMTPDTLLNIASVSKTFTAAALMQLWEKGLFQLDDPVNGFLPFTMRHPRHDAPITFRHLLTHTSAIHDSRAYYASYSCGDPAVTLAEWLESYLLADGKHYHAEENFQSWPPGGGYSYSNVGFGLLGYLVECISGLPFTRYCSANLFKPLMMDHSGWLLSEVDAADHAVPYARLDGEETFRQLYREPARIYDVDEPIPLCLYSFPNLSDGLVRSSVRDLARYAAAFSIPRYDGIPLKPATMQQMFTPHASPRSVGSGTAGLGLAWFYQPDPDDDTRIQYWYHNGGDPGVNTRLQLSLERRGAVIILTNSNHPAESMNALSGLIWQIE